MIWDISNCTNMIWDIRCLSNILIHISVPLVGTILVNWLYSSFLHLLVLRGERKRSFKKPPKMNKYCIFVISVFGCHHHKIVHIIFMSLVSNFEIYSVTHLIRVNSKSVNGEIIETAQSGWPTHIYALFLFFNYLFHYRFSILSSVS